MTIIFFLRSGGTDLTFILEFFIRNPAKKVNYYLSLSISKHLVLTSSLINMRKFNMQESRESVAKQNGGQVKRKEDWRRVLGTNNHEE